MNFHHFLLWRSFHSWFNHQRDVSWSLQ